MMPFRLSTMQPWVSRIAAVAMVLLAGAPASAQRSSLTQARDAVAEEQPVRLTISGVAGPLVSTDWSDTVVLGSLGPAGIVEQVVARDVGVDPAIEFDAAATYWRGRWGFRAHGAFASSCVTTGGACTAGGADVNLWLFDVGGAYSFRQPGSSQALDPYAFVDVGAIAFDTDRPITPQFLTSVQAGPAAEGSPLVIVDDSQQFLLRVDGVNLEAKPAVAVGLGMDVKLPLGGGGVGIRIEAADHISPSPVSLDVTRLGAAPSGAFRPGPVDFGLVHHFRVAAGLVLDIGLP